jgi:hypothetical protein
LFALSLALLLCEKAGAAVMLTVATTALLMTNALMAKAETDDWK